MATSALDTAGATTTGTPNTVSQQAQDVANAQGVSYSAISNNQLNNPNPEYKNYDSTSVGNSIKDSISYKEPSSYIDNAKSTVAGQLNTLLSSDSPYIKDTQQRAETQAGSRGLLNSTIATQAGQSAAIQAALPIAQQDAQSYNQFNIAKQGAENQLQTIQAEGIISGQITQQKAAIDRKNQDIQDAFTAQITGANEQSKTLLSDLQNTYNSHIQNLDIAAKAATQQVSLNADQAKTVATQSSTIMQNYQISVENLLQNPDFLNLGADSVNNAINQLQNLASNAILFVGKSQGVDLKPYTDAYLTSLKVL